LVLPYLAGNCERYSRKANWGPFLGLRRRCVLGSIVRSNIIVEREFPVKELPKKEFEIVKGSRRYREGSKGQYERNSLAMPLVSGVCRTASAPMLSHGGSRLNASKPEANPKTRYPTTHIHLNNPSSAVVASELASTSLTAILSVDTPKGLHVVMTNQIQHSLQASNPYLC
jgi:hypothetical protein